MRKKFLLALVYFILIGILGARLRLVPFFDLGHWDYRYLLHAHSHVATLGWVFNFFLLAVAQQFFNDSWLLTPVRRAAFWGMQITVVIMLIAFSLQGYALWSIAASSVHIILSYVIIWQMVKALKAQERTTEAPVLSHLILRGALLFLAISSIGPWALAVLMKNGYQHHPYYDSSIYWYLHFTYNGWMTLGLLALAGKAVERMGIVFTAAKFLWVKVFILTTGLSYVWSLYGFGLHPFWVALGAAVALLHLYSIYQILQGWKLWAKDQRGWPLYLLWWAVIALWVKVGAQAVSVLPWFHDFAFTSRDAIIAYMHWALLGWVTAGAFTYLVLYYRLGHTWVSKAMAFFFGGLLLQELVLAGRSLGVPVPVQDQLLAIGGLGMTLGGVILFFALFRHKKTPA